MQDRRMQGDAMSKVHAIKDLKVRLKFVSRSPSEEAAPKESRCIPSNCPLQRKKGERVV